MILADAAARARITSEIDRTAFVEAAAGTGKTHATIERVVHGVATGHFRLPEVVVITFTEAAAAELRERLRLELERASAAPSGDGASGDGCAGETERERCRAALDDIDDAAVSTLHAFARRILAEHPLEAGLPPTFEVLDEVAGPAAFGEAWEAFVDELLDDPALEAALLSGLALGLRLDALSELALTLHRHWDRLDHCVSRSEGPLGLPAVPDPGPVAVDHDPVLTPPRRAYALAGEACTDPTDRLHRHLGDVAAVASRLADARDDIDALTMLGATRFERRNLGARGNWREGAKDEVLGLLAEAQAAADGLLARVRSSVLAPLLERLRIFVLATAGARRSEGRLGYHDLLVLARNLLRDDAAVRGLLRARWRHVYIDEFQDTDPLQVELAELLAPPGSGGRLFLVGDPKQSIYRFRRADIGLYQEVRERLADRVEHLTTNFRSDPSILAWANEVFPTLMTEAPGRQPAYVAMDPHRADRGDGPRVTVLGGPLSGPVATVRAVEASEVAATVRAVRNEGRPVEDRGPGETGRVRPARYRDVAILIPTRRSLPALQRALAAAGVPYRIEARSLLLATQEVRDLVNILRAVDDPTDEIALVAALRSPAFACRDDELLAFREPGGRWSYLEPPPDGMAPDHPVVAGLADLAGLHHLRQWTSVSDLVETVVRERRLLELAVAESRPRDHWRRIHYVTELARSFTDGGGATLRGFLDWLESQAEEGATVEEVIVEEGDDDAVRILTIHGAKGLEFPVVVLSGLNGVDNFVAPNALWSRDGELAARLGDFATPGFAPLSAEERAAEEAERVRLLYVAATRARDHLVVSLHHKEGTKCHAARLAAACPTDSPLWRKPEISPDAGPEPGRPETIALPPEVADREGWVARRAERLAGLGSAPVVAATALCPPLEGAARVLASEARAGDDGVEAEEAEDGTERPPWRRGRAGTAVGRAVHAVLQSVDLGTGERLEALAGAQAAAEGVPDRAGDVTRAARAALDSAAVRAAVESGRFWREVYVGAPIGGTVLEGFVDLLFEQDGGLVVVDYKTDRVEGDPEALLHRYRLQGAAYAAALEATLGREVVACTFVFVGDGHAVERDLPDLRTAIQEVEALLR